MVTRRQFIGGGLGLTAGALCPGAWSGLARAQQTSLPYILLVHASGGWDPTMVFDNQLGSSYVTAEPGAVAAAGAGGIPFVHHAGRPAVKSFFDAHGDGAVIVNGLSAGGMVQKDALGNMLGFTPKGRSRPVDWLSYFAASTNPVMDIPHAIIDAPYMPGDHAGIAVRLSKNVLAQHQIADDSLGSDGEKALATFRASAYANVTDGVAPSSLDGEKLRALFYGYAREPAVASRLAGVDRALGARTDESDLLWHGKTAVELFVSGATQCATVQAGRTNLWDTTADHFARQTRHYEALFSDLNRIFEHARQRGILERMLVVVMSERGRGPRLNAQGGKSPWPVTSALLWGPGLKGGSVVQASDAALRAIPINPVFGGSDGAKLVTLTMANVFAAIYLLYDVPYKVLMNNAQPLVPILGGQT